VTVLPLQSPFRGLPSYEKQEPAIDHLWVVVPFSRPGMIASVQANLDRQSFRNFSVLIARNGAASDVHFPNADMNVSFAESKPRVGKVRNTALDALFERDPNAYWVGMDDDDWYGPEYLAEHAALAKPGRLVGKSTHWVHMRGELLLFNANLYANQKGSHLNGATMGGFVREMPRFPENVAWGEDTRFSAEFAYKGGEVWLSSIYHTVYCRRSEGHTFFGDFFATFGSAWAFPEAFLESLPAALPVEYPSPTKRSK